jgi:predicted DCC family thiol-disulfide oxidoreductase YuxK
MPILLFDGHCNLCNAWVNFIIKKDPNKTILFASLQSLAGSRLLEEHKIDTNYIDSLVFIEKERFSVSSTAALRTLSYLSSWESQLKLLLVLPRPLRDFVYRFVARYRYKWFGRRSRFFWLFFLRIPQLGVIVIQSTHLITYQVNYIKTEESI